MVALRHRYLRYAFAGALLLMSLLSGCRRESYIPTLVEEQASLTAAAAPQPGRGSGAQADSPAEISTPLMPPTPTPTREPPASTATTYIVRSGDTLLRIAAAYGTTTESLMALNGLANADQLAIGQVLKVTMEAAFTGPGDALIPDSELVYGPGYADFDVAAELAGTTGYINQYSEVVNGREMSGAEIVELVARQYSVGPRVLLVLLEMRGGWLTNAVPSEAEQLYPLGYQAGIYWDGLYLQLCRAANSLNAGFYGWRLDDLWLVQTLDGTFIEYSADLNAGTAGVQKMLADTSPDHDTWLSDMDTFALLYREFFGDPFAFAVEPLIPPYVGNPELVLPWAEGETWYYTGGPHPGWGTLGAYAAVDFVTQERSIGCAVSQQWVTAVEGGPIVMSDDGMVLQDLDGDGFLGSGWVVLYMHIAGQGRVETGDVVQVGDPIGHPSCEGGVSDASHLHLARRLNGVWIAADDLNWPMSLSGWVPVSGSAAYEGTIVRGDVERTACLCWEEFNAVAH